MSAGPAGQPVDSPVVVHTPAGITRPHRQYAQLRHRSAQASVSSQMTSDDCFMSSGWKWKKWTPPTDSPTPRHSTVLLSHVALYDSIICCVLLLRSTTWLISLKVKLIAKYHTAWIMTVQHYRNVPYASEGMGICRHIKQVYRRRYEIRLSSQPKLH